MRAFWKMMKEYLAPYRAHLGGAVVLNLLSAVFNVFSFAVLIPILNILFRLDTTPYQFIEWGTPGYASKDILVNNAYWWVSSFSAQHGAITTLLLLCLAMTAFTLLKTSCYFGSAAVMVPIRTGIVKDLRNRLYGKILALPLGYFSQQRKGDLLSRISTDVQEVETSVAASVDMLIKDPILLVAYFAVLVYTSPELTLFTVCFVPAFVWTMGRVGKHLKRKSLEAQGLWSETLSQVEETLGGIRVVKAFNAQGQMARRFARITEAMRAKVARVQLRQALAHPVSELLGTVMLLVVLFFGGALIIRGKGLFGGNFIDASQFIFFLVILYSVIEPIKELSKAAYGIPKGLASMERIQHILDQGSDIREKENPVPVDGFREGIRFHDVSFAYEDGVPVLEHIDLFIPKGKTVAIVGESGAGKSTLADLIPRFWDVTSGQITLDGVDIRDLSLKGLRGLMGNVNQDPVLFNDTLFNNIAFGVEGATEADVERAAAIAGADGFIRERPEGYGAMAGDRGVKLSGGQRQRISIARAILKNPPILILDEATASLDTESEQLVREALDRLMENRTTLAIAHRLSTVREADEIVVLRQGRIVERGTHESLLALGGYYKKLIDLQKL